MSKAGGVWTSARYWSFIRSALRKAWMRYPVKQQALKAARRNSQSDNRRLKYEYQCNACKGWFEGKEVQVDHIKPAGSLRDYKDLPMFVERLFCEPDNLQVLCKPCHLIKSKQERKKK
jgi:5-methylcytosine-specific restriction endonuclease McrA